MSPLWCFLSTWLCLLGYHCTVLGKLSGMFLDYTRPLSFVGSLVMVNVSCCVALLGHLRAKSPTEASSHSFLTVSVSRWKESHKLVRVVIGFGVGLYRSSRVEPLITSPPFLTSPSLPADAHDPNIPPDLLLGGTVASSLTTQANPLPLHSTPHSPCRSPQSHRLLKPHHNP